MFLLLEIEDSCTSVWCVSIMHECTCVWCGVSVKFSDARQVSWEGNDEKQNLMLYTLNTCFVPFIPYFSSETFLCSLITLKSKQQIYFKQNSAELRSEFSGSWITEWMRNRPKPFLWVENNIYIFAVRLLSPVQLFWLSPLSTLTHQVLCSMGWEVGRKCLTVAAVWRSLNLLKCVYVITVTNLLLLSL